MPFSMMTGRNVKKNLKITAALIFFNFILIFNCVRDGIRLGYPAFRFEENQVVTFLSALLLGLTGWSSLINYRLLHSSQTGRKFWLFSFFGFLYLCLDEYFMAHEGIDDLVASLFRRETTHLEMDGITIAGFGLLALLVCWFFRKEIFRDRSFLFFLAVGGICLAGTIFFDLFKQLGVWGIVVEESFKIVGVSSFFSGYSLALFSTITQVCFLKAKP
ncbi:MAG: hypothetical protein NC911_08185 [Candidatus Omnitrophica bacterium]|nr:hypothetical protein [Candidatus Omnitrophota bacterium]